MFATRSYPEPLLVTGPLLSLVLRTEDVWQRHNHFFIEVCGALSLSVCVFYYCRTYYKAVRVGGGGEWRTCAMRDDEPRPVWMSLLITHSQSGFPLLTPTMETYDGVCVLLLQDLITKLPSYTHRIP